MNAVAHINDDVDAVEGNVHLLSEDSTELLQRLHIQQALVLVVFGIHLRAKLVLGIKLYHVLTAHEVVRDGSAHRGVEPCTNAVYLVNTLFVRKIRLTEDVAVKEALETKRLIQARLFIDAEEDVRELALHPYG